MGSHLAGAYALNKDRQALASGKGYSVFCKSMCQQVWAEGRETLRGRVKRKLLASRGFIYHPISWPEREGLAPSECNKDTSI